MSYQEATDLVLFGQRWCKSCWIEGDYDERDKLIAEFNKKYEDAGITIKRGFQAYDPVIRVNGVAYKYLQIVEWAANKSTARLCGYHAHGGSRPRLQELDQ